jgi:hypothetical protein
MAGGALYVVLKKHLYLQAYKTTAAANGGDILDCTFHRLIAKLAALGQRLIGTIPRKHHYVIIKLA